MSVANLGITPGPWDYRDGYNACTDQIGVKGQALCTVWVRKPVSRKDGPNTETEAWAEGEANARAIAEVPAMIEAMEGLLREFVDSTVPLDAQFSSAIVIKEVEHARAILARIRGAA